jgi:hypothetical protein
MENDNILVEAIHFRLVDGVTDEAFLEASDALQAHIFDRIDGFLSREITKEDPDRQWTIIVRFRDAKSCNRASNEMMASESGSKLLKMINPSSMQMTRTVLIKEYVKG